MFDPPFQMFESAVDPRVCDVVLEDSRKLKLLPAQVGPEGGRQVKDYRDTLVAFFPQEHWITGLLYHFSAIANGKLWQLALTAPTPVQYAEYGESGFYDWHMDMGGDPPNATTTRKVTVVLSLSDGDEYQGGDLELKLGWDNRSEQVVPLTGARRKGSVVVFPSIMPHRVTPVTAGTRRTAVCWLIGPRLR